jgi:PAS domain S-box-containing protein
VYSGLSHERSLGFGWLDAIHPDDRDATLAAWQQAAETGSYEIEHRIRRQSDGAYRWHQTRASAYATENGQEVELVGTSTDIHELRSLQNRQQVLLAELQHRTRNLLALVQAMARKTLRSAESLDAFANEFEGRLTALSRVQGLVASTTKGMLDLRPLLEAELKARGEWPSNKIRIDGPDIEIPTRTAQTLALALHELATNALKYGAIGQPSGRLDVTWRVEAADGQCPRIILEWTESGVSMPDVPSTRRGYGRELIERALPHQLSAETTMEFGSDGVRCVIVVPVAPEPDDKANIPQFNLASGST